MIKGHTLHSDYALGCRLPLEQWTWLNRTGAFEQPSLRPYVAPFPPLQLMENVSGLRNEQDFASHGVDLYAAVSMISPKPLTEYRNILDFGCGCGRLSRMFKGHPHEVSGCDIDKRHVEWVSKNIDFMTASVSSIHPPLPYPSNHFDCVISISVFSHLSEKSQDEFLADLCRISQPGAYLFVSVHGENAMQRAVHEKPIREMLVVEEAPFQEAQQRIKQGQHAFILQKGHLTSTVEDRARFPFFRKRREHLIQGAFEYGIAFIPLNYIQNHWSRWFEIVDFRPGAIHDFQDLVVLSPKKRNSRGHLSEFSVMTNPVSRIRNKLKQVLSPFRGDARLSTPTIPSGRFRSRFGGLWTDSPDALAILERKVTNGNISSIQAEQLKCWIESGYVALPEAVDTSTVDALLADVDSIYSGTMGNCFVETWESGKLEVIPVTPRHKMVQHKLLDIYSVSEAARKAQFSPVIGNFLKLVFERSALAFQSLHFQFGSEQALHQDSAFVKVSSPMELVASWIALEDIQEGSGELEYVPGSQTIDEYIFESKSKWLPDNSPEYHSFIAHIAAECERRGLPRRKFLPKKGDAFIWSADLAHGGSKITKQGTTRRSFVTHYCPADITPLYFKFSHSGKIELGNGHYVAFAKRT